MDAVGKNNDVRLGGWVDPEGSAGESRVAVGADWEQLPAVARIRRIDIPPEPAQDRLVGRRLRLGELLHGERAEDAHAPQFAAVEQHLRVARQVVSRGKQARMPGHAAHVARRGVVYYPAQRWAV